LLRGKGGMVDPGSRSCSTRCCRSRSGSTTSSPGRLLSVCLYVPGPHQPRRAAIYAGYPSSHYPGLDLRDCPIAALLCTVTAEAHKTLGGWHWTFTDPRKFHRPFYNQKPKGSRNPWLRTPYSE
jgi:hypothetical protein